METENRTPREMTYQVGWKRGKIKHSPECGTSDAPLVPGHPLQRWNQAVLWRKARVPGGSGLLLGGLFALPAALFALFVWAVYELARYS
ncbi:hypothetical protein [Paenibacillus validus]|uniref:Uncharacterized protein n=1 Tax=Paenibacillus validus TaxID=44253 RepID=A0A7X2ZEE5_9BACL|nr:hypothetical protein [Paenibacillus validus]MUG73352.1 hypothetical protein [Paenibacillus validus]